MAVPTLGTRAVTTRFAAMGTHAEVTVVDGDPAVADEVQARIAQLEASWSRFRTDSDTSRLNDHSGSWVPVSRETIILLERSVAAARATDGRFDPTVGGALLTHGYDRTFAAVADHALSLHPDPVIDASWPAIEVDAGAGSACIPPGTVFDPGGIGKGLAVDLVTAELGDQAGGLMVNLGGDLRATGTAPDPAGWIVAIEDPLHPSSSRGRLAIPEGAVATSSQMRRRWCTAEGQAHHIIDPTTGRPARSDVAAATVVAAAAWWAEAHATSLLIQGRAGLDRIDDTVHALLVLTDGTVAVSPTLEGVLR